MKAWPFSWVAHRIGVQYSHHITRAKGVMDESAGRSCQTCTHEDKAARSSVSRVTEESFSSRWYTAESGLSRRVLNLCFKVTAGIPAKRSSSLRSTKSPYSIETSFIGRASHVFQRARQVEMSVFVYAK